METITADGTLYEVVWPIYSPVTEPLPAPPIRRMDPLPEFRSRPKPEDIDAAVEAVYACLSQQPCSFRGIKRVTGLAQRQIQSALQRLKRQRRVVRSQRTNAWRVEA